MRVVIEIFRLSNILSTCKMQTFASSPLLSELPMIFAINCIPSLPLQELWSDIKGIIGRLERSVWVTAPANNGGTYSSLYPMHRRRGLIRYNCQFSGIYSFLSWRKRVESLLHLPTGYTLLQLLVIT